MSNSFKKLYATGPMAEPVRLEITEHAAIITLDSPPLNIFDLAMRDGLIEALLAVRELDDLGAMILGAAGDHFSAGADLSEFGTAASIHEARRIRWDRDPWGLLLDLPIPTIASMHGVAVGSGLEMAMLCDLRVAAPSTKVGLPETKLGMLPAAGGTQSLTRIVGPNEAVPIVALAETMEVSQATERGLISQVDDDPDRRALELAERFASQDPAVLRALKQTIRAASDLDLDTGLVTERRLSIAATGLFDVERLADERGDRASFTAVEGYVSE